MVSNRRKNRSGELFVTTEIKEIDMAYLSFDRGIKMEPDVAKQQKQQVLLCPKIQKG